MGKETSSLNVRSIRTESVRRASTALKGTPFYVIEQFPKDIAERQQALVPLLKRAIRSGKQAWITYAMLYIDGKPVRETNQPDGGTGSPQRRTERLAKAGVKSGAGRLDYM